MGRACAARARRDEGDPMSSGPGRLDGLFDLTGSVALVTGGNGGVGLAMASGMAAAGATVCIWGTNEAKNAAAVEQLSAYGGIVEARAVDVASEHAVVAGFAAVVERCG